MSELRAVDGRLAACARNSRIHTDRSGVSDRGRRGCNRSQRIFCIEIEFGTRVLPAVLEVIDIGGAAEIGAEGVVDSGRRQRHILADRLKARIEFRARLRPGLLFVVHSVRARKGRGRNQEGKKGRNGGPHTKRSHDGPF